MATSVLCTSLRRSFYTFFANTVQKQGSLWKGDLGKNEIPWILFGTLYGRVHSATNVICLPGSFETYCSVLREFVVEAKITELKSN